MKKLSVLIVLLSSVVFSCNTNDKTNSPASDIQKPKNDLTEISKNKDNIFVLGTFGDFKDTLNTIYSENGGIDAIVKWSTVNLKINSKIKFIKSNEEGPKKDTIITISGILIEKLDVQGNETGFFYLGNPNKIDNEKSDLFYSYRENFKDEKYNLVIYKNKH